MRLRSLWDSYGGRVVWGSVGLFVMLPLLTYALGGGYALGVYIGTGIAVLLYTVETYYLRKNAWTANQAGLLKAMLEEHDRSVEDRKVVHAWWRKNPKTAIARYEEELRRQATGQGATTEVVDMDDCRRKVSQYFARLRALCEEDMLDAKLVATTLGCDAIQVFLLYVDPLDETVRRVAGKEHNVAEREYFRAYLRQFYPETAGEDPWGFR